MLMMFLMMMLTIMITTIMGIKKAFLLRIKCRAR